MEHQDAIDVSEDAFGLMLRDHLRGRAGGAILEVDGGSSGPALVASVFFSSYEHWAEPEREALKECEAGSSASVAARGATLCTSKSGGSEVVAVDISPGAVEVARARGVRDVRVLEAEKIDEKLGSFDSSLMMCSSPTASKEVAFGSDPCIEHPRTGQRPRRPGACIRSSVA